MTTDRFQIGTGMGVTGMERNQVVRVGFPYHPEAERDRNSGARNGVRTGTDPNGNWLWGRSQGVCPGMTSKFQPDRTFLRRVTAV